MKSKNSAPCAVRSAQYAAHNEQFSKRIFFSCALAAAYCTLTFLASCGPSAAEEELDTPTKGKITFSVDENVQSLANELVYVFEESYPDAFLITSFKEEAEIVNDLYHDSTRLALMTRQLNASEMAYFDGLKFGVEQIRIGSDAIVFIVNKENTDTAFTKETLRKMLTGEDSLWSQVDSASKLARIDVIFDNGASSNLRFLTDSLLNGAKPGNNVFAAANVDSVIAYVARNPAAIGIVALNAIGDKDSELAVSRKNQVKVCAVGLDSLAAYKPSQSAVVTRKYPFVRDIWIIKIGKRAGLGTGFASFALGDRGQLIVQKAGLAPAAPAERTIELTTY
jgi:phosphate transport system substrate-binding protein